MKVKVTIIVDMKTGSYKSVFKNDFNDLVLDFTTLEKFQPAFEKVVNDINSKIKKSSKKNKIKKLLN